MSGLPQEAHFFARPALRAPQDGQARARLVRPGDSGPPSNVGDERSGTFLAVRFARDFFVVPLARSFAASVFGRVFLLVARFALGFLAFAFELDS